MWALARAAAENCRRLSRAGIARVVAAWSRRAFSFAESVDALSPPAYAANGLAGWSGASGSGRNELADRESAFDDGIVLSPNHSEAQNPDRVWSVSFRSICGEIADPFPWI